MSSTEATKPAVPDHVPAELVWNHSLDAFNRELDDPYLAASRLHDGPDIIWAAEALYGKPAWVLTRQALMQEAFIDTAHFSSVRSSAVNEVLGGSWRLLPLEVDPPLHHAYRSILNPYFTPHAAGALDQPVRDLCVSLIDEFKDRQSCEFVGEFASVFPSYVFLALMGMPRAMLPQFLDWEQDLLRGSDVDKRIAAARAILQYLQGFVAEQQANPQTELMKAIVSAQVEGRPIEVIEILGICYLLYIGGLDTVYSSLGWIMRHLASHPELQDRLRANPQDIPRAVEELTRAFGVATPHRTIAKDLVFHGVPMRKGDIVLLPTYLASRDPRAYDNPHLVDIDRRARSISFATGPHTCLGIHLAKREIRTVIEAFLSRFDNIRIPEGERYAYHTGGVLGVDRLPLQWDKAGAA